MQTTYDAVQGRVRLALVGCHRHRHAVTGERVGRWDAHRFPWWTLVWSGARGYQARGAGGSCPGAVIERPPRSWALHAPHTDFHERIAEPDPAREFLYLFLTMGGDLPPLAQRRLTVVLDHEDRLADQVRAMHQAQERGTAGDALLAHGYLLAVIGELVVCAHDGGEGSDAAPWRLRPPGPPATTPGLLAAVDLQVVRRLAKPPSRSQLAAALNLSVSSLAHRFQAETGLTLVERIRWLRIREAKLRLAEPDATVKSVARALGFSSPAYFSLVFKEVAGIAPEDYRRRCR